jgi:ElaB/YqjD/DUF883 family membrane-anchored ribosome-binding protein
MGIVSKVEASTRRALDEVAEVAATASHTRLIESTCKYVSAHPLQSLGLALLAGYLIGRVNR